jgi:hypothetical protein
MAGRGPAPKPQLTRDNDQARREAATTKVTNDGVLRGMPLPNETPWHPRTVAWWATWRRSPLAQTFTEADWDFLLDTALLHSEMWNGETKLAAEIRLRVSAFGSTPEARLRLKLKIDNDVVEIAQTVNMDDARRNRLKAISG